MARVGLSGGEALEARLREIADRVDRSAEVRVGFLEGSTEPDGTSVPLVAAVNEFGSPKKGIPARPFFRGMIAAKSPEWGDAVAKALVASNYSASGALAVMGEGIKGQLQDAITQFVGQPLAPATIATKGFDKQLIDTGVMLQSVDYEIEEA